MEKAIKIILALLLFLCLLNMPYGYYQLVRFLALVTFSVLAYNYYVAGDHKLMIASGFLALLFQPFFKVALGREIWNVVDVIVGIGLIISLFTTKLVVKEKVG